MTLQIQQAAFDPGATLNAFQAAHPGVGAVVSFTGIVRDEGATLTALEIEHYAAMTGPAISAIAEQAIGRWQLAGALVIHRYGRLLPGETIMMVATAAKHRAGAFASADFLMDYLKSRAPFWKKAFSAGGSEWVSAKAEDEAALHRWSDLP
ncbi:molybdenum cofactor biosynthesis protein MoaE [Xinfangfangia sp. D13-10-4-6]|uniref:molybdenum cofactor biosynthesis protein MoaE n=1 Tax=Pseudogemmobacter hezensis TaxID=2737662 RepID=UPI0015537CF9|nr:molybdenum cofactor biosynthesis protein MoaE [Pseudogemmobacter hezensis]NPD13772.1 molybdenum cofactor biosynthesis protein MoaE [Pseudogemmobacter hezensis]